MPDRYTISVEIDARDRTGPALGTVKRGFGEAFNEVVTGALRKGGMAAAEFAAKLPAMAIELGKLGVQVQSSEKRFTQFAGGADRAAMFLDAFNEGTDRTVDRMTAMSSASRLLQMGLVDTGDEMSQIAAMAVKLGDQTEDTSSRISGFGAMLANQSIPRLDNYGISSGRVRKRIEELQKTIEGLSREEAFKMAVIEEGSKALNVLGDTSEDAATRIAQTEAAWKDTKQAIGESLLSIADSTGLLEAVPRATRLVATEMEAIAEHGLSVRASFASWRGVFDKNTTMIEAYVEALEKQNQSELNAIGGKRGLTTQAEKYNQVMQWMTGSTDQASISTYKLTQEQTKVATAARGSNVEWRRYNELMDKMTSGQEESAEAAWKLSEAQREASAAEAQGAAEARLSTAMQYADFEKTKTQDAERLTEKRTEIERKHQEKLTEIARKGRSWRKQVNEEELALDVRIAQGRLAELLARESEFNAETSDLDRARTTKSIRSLEEEIQEKTRLLEQAQDGYVLMTGQNVDTLIAEENRQYEESLLSLEESQAAKEEAQRQSLGRMVLAHFNAWAEMNLAADGYTQEEAAFVTRMRQDISTQYGLITETAVAAMNEQESEWEDMLTVMRAGASSFFDYFQKQFNALPSEKLITIRTEMATPETAGPTRGGDVMQHGSAFAPGGWATVGERGPELAYIPRGAQVFPADQSRHMTTNHYNLTVNSNTPSAGVANEFYLMESMAR